MASPLFDLTGKIAVVTGSSKGIGKSIAMHLALSGAKVVVSSRKAPACEEAAAEIRKAGGHATVIPCNISDKAQVERLFAETRTNMWMVNLCLPDMRAKKDGSIMIVSSIGGVRGSPVIGAYCISKAADMQLARNLALEYGPDNIRVNTIAPGLVKTDFAKALWDDPKYLEKRLATAPLRRIGEPDDIAGLAVLLAGKAGAFITGQTLIADAGVTIGG
jgi:NAD(P)-dependent dehydrogenase (short-subunit alcohol dehydrogenase family)